MGLQGGAADGGGERLPRVVKAQAVTSTRLCNIWSAVLRVARLAENEALRGHERNHFHAEIDHVWVASVGRSCAALAIVDAAVAFS